MMKELPKPEIQTFLHNIYAHAGVLQGLKRTIACMDEERPRTETSISNRSHLRAILHIEDLYRQNKVRVLA